MFALVLNGEEPRFGTADELLLRKFEESLGPKFWDHCAVVITHWGSSEEAKKRRKKAKKDKESLEKMIRDKFAELCPDSKGKNIKIHFTDVFEMNSDGSDPTSKVLQEFYTQATKKDDFDCAQTAAVSVTYWKDAREELTKIYEKKMKSLKEFGEEYS